MSVAIAPQALAALGFRQAPGDVAARDVVLAALWHQHLHAVLLGLSATTPIRDAQFAKASGLPDRDFRQALHELIAQRLIAPAWIPDSYLLTPAGHREVRRLLDVDQILSLAKTRQIGQPADPRALQVPAHISH